VVSADVRYRGQSGRDADAVIVGFPPKSRHWPALIDVGFVPKADIALVVLNDGATNLGGPINESAWEKLCLLLSAFPFARLPTLSTSNSSRPL
jgi:hypothetical protein